MKSSQLAKKYLTQELAHGVFEQCEQMVLGITSGVSVPLPLSSKDEDIIVDVVINKVKEVYFSEIPEDWFKYSFDRTMTHRAAGLFKQWLIKKGRIK